jgi:hypothetical protein
MITTIPRNHTRKIAALAEKLTVCKLFTLNNNFVAIDIDPKFAWENLAKGDAKLTDLGDGKYVIRIHSNCWYELTEAPAKPAKPAKAESPKRVARVMVPAGKRGAEHADTVAAYLPSNYRVTMVVHAPGGSWVAIEGRDRLGWTLDGYVIPRLMSGLIRAEEINKRDLPL